MKIPLGLFPGAMIEEQLWLSEIKGSGNKSRAIVQCFLFWSEQKKKDKILCILPASMASMASMALPLTMQCINTHSKT